MFALSPRLDFDTARHAEPWDAWATITLIVASAVLSVRDFQGTNLEFLVVDETAWPLGLWNLFTTTLLHGGWLHLAFNLYWILRFGVLLEAMLGTLSLSLILVLLGAGSTAAQYAFDGPCIGLSGIGYGLFGLLWALDRWHPRCRGVLEPRLAEGFGLWFLFCIAATWMDVLPVANIAHAAGFVLGALLGQALAKSDRRLLRAAAIPGLLLTLGLLYLPGVRGAVNRSDGYTATLFQRAFAASNEGREGEAVELYREVLAREPESTAAAHNLGLALIELEREEEAVDAFRAALEHDPDLPSTLRTLGDVLGDLERYEEAHRALRRAHELDPSDAWTRTNLGWTLGMLERYEEGQRILRALVTEDPSDAWAQATFGWLQLEGGDERAALVALTRAAELDPGVTWVHALRARLLLDDGRILEALAASELALQADPSDLEMREIRDYAQKRLGRE